MLDESGVILNPHQSKQKRDEYVNYHFCPHTPDENKLVSFNKFQVT